MKNLKPPNIEAETLYKNVVANKNKGDHKTRLQNIQTYIFSMYNEYERLKSNLENIMDTIIYEEEDKNALESCYTRNENGYLDGEIVKNIISIQSPQNRDYCPYCGIDSPKTIDHYIPQSSHSEFAIYPMNLIPCCYNCNSTKNRYWKESGKRLFINFYYDDLPAQQFLKLDIMLKEPERNSVVARYYLEQGAIPNYLFEIIETHFERLNLLEEYSKRIETEISDIRYQIVEDKKMKLQDYKRILRGTVNSYTRIYGINSWKTVLYNQLLNYDDFFHKCVSDRKIEIDNLEPIIVAAK
jgi:hypothetical protein